MNTNDQWFEPGDKVMRVCTTLQLGLPEGSRVVGTYGAGFGVVLCVDRCSTSKWGNRVRFIGIMHQTEKGFVARCFRKVSEIKLCVRAAESLKRGTEQPSTVEVGV